jgi:alpha-glucosidase
VSSQSKTVILFRTCILIAALVALTISNPIQKEGKDWYKNSLIYQIYPRSFKDSDGDGVGDLKGITSKLEHVADIGADALWLSPIYASPQVDFGYDISNFTDIHKEYGTLDDFDALVAKAKKLGLKVILDFVPNHSSDQHEWFKKSVKKIKPYDEYYIWRDARNVSGVRKPPNNWLSSFTGPAWNFSEERGQYYLHQFAAGQPDLNYYSSALQEEMKKVLTFWMNRGVEGFRIDAINHMYEDPRFLDEPLSNIPGVPEDDYDYLNHIYTKNRNETYEVLKTWRKLMDDHSETADTKMILTEAYADFDLTIKYYQSGSTVPFNFMFMADLNNKSSAVDLKSSIDRWMKNVPEGAEYVANWVVGNHDNHRAASRFGERRADQLSMLAIVLPGVSVVYNGDEIGMIDRNFSFNETQDPAGCNAGPERYHLKSRDPERTPFQWDDSTSAGFSTNETTWLPVNENYKTLNLEAQKSKDISHYKVFKSLARLKKQPVIELGSLETGLYCDDCTFTENVLGVVRRHGASVVALLVNFDDDKQVVVDIRTWLNIPEDLIVYAPSVGSGLLPGSYVDRYIILPGAASVVFTTEDLDE